MDSIERLRLCQSHDPFGVLSWHMEKGSWILRVFRPDALRVAAVSLNDGKRHPLPDQGTGQGIYEGVFRERFAYQLEIESRGGITSVEYDPYSFDSSVFTDYDFYLFAEGNHLEIHRKLGAHRRQVAGIEGFNFSVWAPNARGVSVVGDFNRWDGRIHQMKSTGRSGIWELFVPGMREYCLYKFEIRTGSSLLVKSDPFGSFFEKRPGNASVTYSSGYRWKNGRIETGDICSRPVAIYEIHAGSWKKKGDGFIGYREMAGDLPGYLKDTGFNWVEFMPLGEHPLDSSWGYQSTGYFAPTSRHGSPDDFRYLVDSLHEKGIGVIMDWTAAHFPKDSFGLYSFDGTHLFEHFDPRKREHPDWKSAIFNYGRHEVASFLSGSALNWLESYNIDALRVDGVASMLYLDYSRKKGEWIPNEYGGNENIEAVNFLKKLNTAVSERFPDAFTVAEESTSWPMVTGPVKSGGLGFRFKWNMGWMHDTLGYISADPLFRKYRHQMLTFGMLYAYSENFILPFSHDEVVYGKKSLMSKMPGDEWQKFAGLRLLLTYMYCYPGKKLLFMGNEFGQVEEWNHQGQLDWHLLLKSEHAGIKKLVSDLNRIYMEEKALYEADFEQQGFQWIDFSDFEKSAISFIRRGREKNDFLVAAFNFTPVARFDYRIGVPARTDYSEIMNSDSAFYGGGNKGNLNMVKAETIPFHSQPFSARVTLPPLGGIILKPAVNLKKAGSPQ